MLLLLSNTAQAKTIDSLATQLITCMCPSVFLQISGRSKLLIARNTRKLLPRVFHHVRLQLACVIADFIAYRALVRLFPRVFPHVHG